MKTLPIGGLVSVFALAAFVHFGTPFLAEGFYELYHLIKVDAVYTAYSAARYLTANFMIWDGRWIVTGLIAFSGTTAVLWRWQSRKNPEGSSR